jgi:hypothetical protein
MAQPGLATTRARHRIALLLPIHSVERAGKTGDYFFAGSFAEALRARGHEVRRVVQSKRGEIEPDEIVILIRGRLPFREKLGRLDVAWHISKPPRYRDNDFEFADYIFAGSDVMAKRARKMRGVPEVEVMYQAFDPAIMYADDTPPGDHLVFVGTPRKEHLRPVVSYAAQSGLPFQLWGDGWEKTPYSEFQVGGNVDNAELGRIYRESGAVITDHLPHMRRNMVTSNRVFDGVACGRPVVSDIARGFPTDIAPMIHAYEDAETFRIAAQAALAASRALPEEHQAIARAMPTTHSFAARADQMLATIDRLLAE